MEICRTLFPKPKNNIPLLLLQILYLTFSLIIWLQSPILLRVIFKWKNSQI